MLDTFLVPVDNTVDAKGDGAVVDVGGTGHRVFLLTLHITKIVEQEALGISIYGSTDGSTWGQKPLTTLPQKFYCGAYPVLLDLLENPEVRFLRAHWDVERWGRGPEAPLFTFSLAIREVPADVLSEARREASARV